MQERVLTSRVEHVNDEEEGRDSPHQPAGRSVVKEYGVIGREDASFKGVFFGGISVSDPSVPDRIPFNQ